MDAVVGVAVVLASGFVPAPLVIDEDDREALDRTRSGVRDLAGGEAESREDDAATRRERRSPRCDRPAQDPYDYCGTCARPVPEQRPFRFSVVFGTNQQGSVLRAAGPRS